MQPSRGPKKRNKPRPLIAVKPVPLVLLEPGARLRPLHRILLLLMFLLLALFAFRQVGSADAGFHLKAGEYILSGHGWPVNDTFTYTLNDQPYIDTSWGYQVLLVLAEHAAGAPGMVVLHLLMLTGLFYLLYRTARLAPVDPATLVFLFGAGIVACETRYEVRPEVLSYLIFAAILHVLHRRALGFKTALWLLPLLLWVWANSHALFALGWAAIACVAAGLWIRDHKPDKELLWWGGASLLSPLVNPYVFKGWVYPFTLLTRFQSDNPFAKNIMELGSPFSLRLSEQYRFYVHWPIWTFRMLAVFAAAALVLLLIRRKYWAAFLVLAFFPLAARAIHNIPLLVLTALPPMIWAMPFTGLWRLLGMGERRARRAGIVVLMAAGVLAAALGLRVMTGAYYVASRSPARFGWNWDSRLLPVDAAAYVKRAGLRGPMFNHFNFGAYLMWALPQKVFIDGRNEMMGEEFFTYYQKILSSQEDMEQAARRYGFQWIILPYEFAPDVLARLSADGRWRLAYVDWLAAVFVREGPDAPGWVDRTSVERRAPEAPETAALPGLGGPPRRAPLLRWLSGLIKPPRYPLEAKSRGIFHYFRKEYAQAEAWYRAALASGGDDYYEFYHNLGSALFWQKKYAQAAACFRVVLEEDPDNRIARDRLAACLEQR